MLTQSNRWAAAGAIAGAALIIYNPLTYLFTDTLFLARGYIASRKDRCPTNFGYLVHTIVLFFVVYGLLCINWACE